MRSETEVYFFSVWQRLFLNNSAETFLSKQCTGSKIPNLYRKLEECERHPSSFSNSLPPIPFV